MAESKPFLPPRWFIRVAWAVHRAIYRVTGGRRGLRPATPKNYGLMRIHTIGRTSGAERVAILGYVEDGPNVFTLAMNGWGKPEPAWWLNLQAQPAATIDLPTGSRAITARAATGEERARLWSSMQQIEPNLDAFATRRPTETAVVVFEPREETTAQRTGMKAAVRDRYGVPDVVRIERVDAPIPADDEVLVRVHVASVNRADLDGIEPRPPFTRLFLGLRRPRHREVGIDVAGVVEAVGSGVTAFQPGDRVFADLYPVGGGAFAELVCAPERRFLEIPAALSFEQAATLPHSAILAIQGLRQRRGREVKAGDRVLIVGASGNVGPFAVQIAKARGAEVTGVSRTEKMDFVRSLGVDHVIDYTKVDITRTGERYDWILDTDSHHSIVAMRRCLRSDGVYVTLGGSTWPILGALVLGPVIGLAGRRSMGLMLWWHPFDPADVATLTGLVADGTIRPAIDRRYLLDQVVDALRWVNDGQSKGKVLVTVHEDGGGADG